MCSISTDYVLGIESGLGWSHILFQSKYISDFGPFYSLSIDKYLVRFEDNLGFNQGLRLGIKYYHNLVRDLGLYPYAARGGNYLKYLNIHLGVQRTLKSKFLVSLDSDYRIFQFITGSYKFKPRFNMEFSIAYILKNYKKKKNFEQGQINETILRSEELNIKGTQ